VYADMTMDFFYFQTVTIWI